MSLTTNLKRKLAGDIKRELAIVRGMVYNNYQEWLRKIYNLEGKLGVVGEAREAMKLDDKDLEFIDQEAIKIMTAPIPDSLFKIHAQQIYNEISAMPLPKQTIPQKQLKEELREALEIEEELPF